MKILVASAKAEFSKLDKIVETLRGLEAVGVEFVRADEIDWEQRKAETGSWDKAYAWAARSFERLILTETDLGGFGRGQFELWRLFTAHGKKVGFMRTGMNKPEPVSRLSLSSEGDWKMKYAVLS